MSLFTDKQRQAKEEAAKEAIYEAALKVISRKKHEGLKMQEIAESAGIATGTLYNYFRNKESLLYYVDGKLRESILDSMQAFAETGGPALQRLADLTGEILRYCEEHYGVFDLAEQYGIDQRIPRDEKQSAVDRAVGCIKGILDDGIAEGSLRRIDTFAAARTYFYALIGLIKVQGFIGERSLGKSGKELLSTFQAQLQMRGP